MHLLAAHIIGGDIFTDYHTITIDRGKNDGVKRGMGVIAINGVVGYAIEVEPGNLKGRSVKISRSISSTVYS